MRTALSVEPCFGHPWAMRAREGARAAARASAAPIVRGRAVQRPRDSARAALVMARPASVRVGPATQGCARAAAVTDRAATRRTTARITGDVLRLGSAPGGVRRATPMPNAQGYAIQLPIRGAAPTAHPARSTPTVRAGGRALR